jgi:hypothetical protein
MIGRNKEKSFMMLSNSKRIVIEVKFQHQENKRKRQIRRPGRDDAQQIPQRKIQKKQTSDHES